MNANFFIPDGVLGIFIVIVMLVNCVLGISFATQSGWKLIYSSWAVLFLQFAAAILALSTPISYEICHIAGGFSLIISVICFCNLLEETKVQRNSDRRELERGKGKSW